MQLTMNWRCSHSNKLYWSEEWRRRGGVHIHMTETKNSHWMQSSIAPFVAIAWIHNKLRPKGFNTMMEWRLNDHFPRIWFVSITTLIRTGNESWGWVRGIIAKLILMKRHKCLRLSWPVTSRHLKNLRLLYESWYHENIIFYD